MVISLPSKNYSGETRWSNQSERSDLPQDYCHIITINITLTQVLSLQKSFIQYLFGINTSWSTDFLHCKFGVKFHEIYISDSQNSLEIPATQTYYFINFEMTTKLSVLKFISSIKNIIAVGLPGLLWELRLRSRDANCFVIAAKIIYQSCMPCGPIYIDILVTMPKRKGKNRTLSRMTRLADFLASYPDSWSQYHVTSWSSLHSTNVVGLRIDIAEIMVVQKQSMPSFASIISVLSIVFYCAGFLRVELKLHEQKKRINALETVAEPKSQSSNAEITIIKNAPGKFFFIQATT